MKIKHLFLLVITSIFVVFAGLTTIEQTAAQTQGTENLLDNPCFENGYYNQDGIPEIAVPNGWRMHWLDNVSFPGSDGPAARPETVVWLISDAPPDEQTLFFRDGSYALKVFKGGRPVLAALSQDVTGLEVGRKYRLIAPIYIDIVASYTSSGKIAPNKLDSGQVRLGAAPTGSTWLEESVIAYSGWWTAATTSPFYLAYPVFIHDFTATSENMTVWIEFGSKDPYPNNGFFIDGLGLYTLDEVDDTVVGVPGNTPTPGPSPTPFPTPTPRPDGAIIHVVQSGETLWTIAIQYASALNMTAEEAFPVIKELNGNPAFLNVGQEVIIALPDETAAAVDTAVTTEETTEPAVEETAVPEPTAAPEDPAEVVELAPSEPEAIAADLKSAICVSAFDDENGDGVQNEDETLLADAIFTVARASGTDATYVSDSINEPYCFAELEPDTYQVTFSQPEDYRATTAGNWAVSATGGAEFQVQFGAQYDATAVAAAQPDQAPDTTTDSGAGTAVPESGSRLGTIIIAVVIVLVVLAGVGVVLLRRS